MLSGTVNQGRFVCLKDSGAGNECGVKEKKKVGIKRNTSTPFHRYNAI